MTFMAMVFGVLMGSVYDPVFWLCVAAGAGVAFLPRQDLVLAVALVAIPAGRVALIGTESPLAGAIFVATALAMLAAWGAVRTVRR